MSNSSQGSQKLVEEFGGSFFHWVASEVLPYVLGSVLVICVLVSPVAVLLCAGQSSSCPPVCWPVL